MTPVFNPRRLNVAAFAQAGGHLSGAEPLRNMERMAQEIHRPADDSVINWQAEGGQRALEGGGVQPSIHLQASAELPLTCQRCLGEVRTPVEVDRHFVFVADEATAAHLDEDAEDDVLVLSPTFDLFPLIEDELLMALPLVPRHAVCPQPVQTSVQDAAFDAAGGERPNPFAALAALKDKAGGSGKG